MQPEVPPDSGQGEPALPVSDTASQGEEKFRLMADAVPQIVWVTDADGRVEFFNQQWRDYTGIAFNPATAAEVAAAAVHPDDVSLTMARFDAARRAGTTFLVEHRIRAHDGTYRWFFVKGEPYRDPATGRIARWFGASMDIHDRKEAEESQRQFAARQSFQLALADRIRPLADAGEVIAAATGLLGTQLGVTRVTYGEVEADGSGIVLHDNWTNGTVRSISGLHATFDDFGRIIGAAFRAGEVLAVADVQADPRLAPYAAMYATIEVRSFLAIPLMKHGQVQAILSVHDAVPHAWTDTDIAMARDMVDRTWAAVDSARAQAAARENAERVQLALAAGAIIGTWFWDIAQDRFTVDESFAQAFGLDGAHGRAALAAAQMIAAVHPDDEAALTAAVMAAIREGVPYSHQYRVRRADGRYYWVEATGRVARDAHGKAVSFSGVLVDVEERRAVQAERDQAIRQLRALNAELEQQVAAQLLARGRTWQVSPDILAVLGADGHIEAANPAWTTILGWPGEAVTNTLFLDFVHPDDRERSRAAWQQSVRDNAPMRFDNRYRHKEGGWRWLSWVAVPEEGRLYCSARDITADIERQAALEQAQEQLRQSQKMEAVGQLTGGLAHDFNNLLASIMGGLELTSIRLKQNRPDDVERYMGMAMGATRRAASLTHRLLAFSRRQTLAPMATNVNALVNGMLDIIRRTVGPSIQVDTDCHVELWTALVDQSQLENSLLNLCLNARDAMPDGGRIVIRTGHRVFAAAEAGRHNIAPGDYLSLCVADNGTGMTAEVQSKAFDPFFTTKPLGQGTGLGLSMIYGFARQSGGDARIASVVGEGSEVCLFLPRHHGAAEPARPAREADLAPTANAGKTVLVVDDEPDVRLLVMDVLRDLGHVTIEAADGAAGLEVLQSNVRLDLLVSDVGLPGPMNGRQMVDAGRVHRPGLKVLFITGFAEATLLNNGQLAAGMSVLTKPFPLDALATRIRALLG